MAAISNLYQAVLSNHWNFVYAFIQVADNRGRPTLWCEGSRNEHPLTL